MMNNLYTRAINSSQQIIHCDNCLAPNESLFIKKSCLVRYSLLIDLQTERGIDEI